MRHVEKSDIVVTANDSRVPDEACTVCSDSRAVGVQTRKPRLRGGRRDGERWNMTDIVAPLFVTHVHVTRLVLQVAGSGGGGGMGDEGGKKKIVCVYERERWGWGGVGWVGGQDLTSDRMLDFLHAKIILFGRVRANVKSNLKQQQQPQTTYIYIYSYTDKGQEGEG